MLDIDFIREHPDAVRWAAQAKGFDVDVDRLLELDARRRELLRAVNALRERLNAASKTIPTLHADERAAAVAEVRAGKAELAEIERDLAQLEAELGSLMLVVPSVPVEGTPVGTSDDDNVEISRWGEPPAFGFEPKDHIELALALGLVDFERARRYAGSRSYALTGDGVMLERAVTQFALDHVRAKGLRLVSPPVMVREEALAGTGFFPLGVEETYALERDELYLAGTSEVSLVSQHMDDILDVKALPLRYAGISNCFRREAGAAGRDTRGLYRVHMFTKVEQVSIGLGDADWSAAEHLFLLENSLEILRALELPHRVAIACTGEMGLGQVRKYEIESWMPSRGRYSETHSCSSMHDFQARRLRIRYRDESGKVRFAHTLNNTAVASPRILIPILENYQRADGSVVIPAALRRYMGGREIIESAR